ncbi:lipoprotein [Spiroplasma endosymbiont of Labia minor]|uniref:lipoprotein n=1 Tax=Spiroplasma endosymbiont of Labia minor TaxID=3066305 RepID=UPI0030CE29B1
MRKLLTLLSSFSLTVTGASTVVACSSPTRISNADLNPDYIEKLIAQIIGGSGNLANFGVSLQDIFSEGDLTNIAVKLINTAIGQNNYKNNIKYQENQLGIENPNKDYVQMFNELGNQVAANKFYSTYTNSLNKKAPLDYSIRKQGYSLGANENLFVDDKGETAFNGTAITTFGGKKWQALFEDTANPYVQNIPEGKNLTVNNFAVTSDGTKTLYTKNSDGKVVELNNLSGKEALQWRFQDYFINSVKSETIENLLTMTYEIGQMYNFRSDAAGTIEAYLNKYSPVASLMQTWTSNAVEWTTNAKMVWQYYISVDDATKMNWTEITTTGVLKDLIATNTGQFKNNQVSINDVTKAISDDLPSITTTINSGNDPYFGIGGFKGFIATKDNSIFGDNSLDDSIDSTLKTKIASQVNPGVIMGGINTPYFQGRNTKERVITVVLPIYMVDVLTSFELEENHTIKLGPNASNPSQYSDIWNQNQNQIKHSKDIENLDLESRTSLLAQLQYIVSQDSTISDDAKTVLYSYYLNEEDIYLQGLYDQIGKYIKSDN